MYDAAGNPTTYNGNTCTFDVFNRATSLGTYLTAGYRSDGLRAWKQDSSGNRTYYLYDGDAPLVEMDSSGNYKSEFLYGPAGLISHDRAGLGTVYFAYDALGSVQSISNASGIVTDARTYDAYGNKTWGFDYLVPTRVGGEFGTTTVYTSYDDPEVGYNGQSGYITDAETGLVLCGHRYYDPANGRWLNRDPIGYSGGVNLYSYCTNNPVMGVDTSGLLKFSSSGEGIAGLPVDGDANLLNEMVGDSDPCIDGAIDFAAQVAAMALMAAETGSLAPGPANEASVEAESSSGGGDTVAPPPVTGGGPNFIGTSGPNPTLIAVPDGASGPTPTNNGGGFMFTGGSGGPGLDPKVTGVRIMDPTPARGASPGYPNGYVSWMNGALQTVSPKTGQPIPKTDPTAHNPIP